MFQSLLTYKPNTFIYCRYYGNQREPLNHYETLGVPFNASQKDIRLAFLTLSKKLHPDITGKNTHAEFTKVNEAYNVLNKEHTRQQYDMDFKFNNNIHYTNPRTYYHPQSRRVVYSNYRHWNEASSGPRRDYRRMVFKNNATFIKKIYGIFVCMSFVTLLVYQSNAIARVNISPSYTEYRNYRNSQIRGRRINTDFDEQLKAFEPNPFK